jgi:Tfp pilus assembly protein PilF
LFQSYTVTTGVLDLTAKVLAGDTVRARELLERIRSDDQRLAGRLWQAAWLLARDGENERAAAVFRAAIEDAPSDADALWAFGDFLNTSDAFSELATVATALVAAAPRNADAHFWIARAAHRAGDSARAVEALNNALSLNPWHRAAGALLDSIAAQQ